MHTEQQRDAYSWWHGTAINDTQRTENYHFRCVQSSKLVNKSAVSAMDGLNQQGWKDLVTLCISVNRNRL